MEIRSELHLQRKGDDKYIIPAACFHMTLSERDGFLQVLKDVAVPDGYASNILLTQVLGKCLTVSIYSSHLTLVMSDLD